MLLQCGTVAYVPNEAQIVKQRFAGLCGGIMAQRFFSSIIEFFVSYKDY